MLESQLQRAVLDWLKLNKICAWRMPIGAVTHHVNGREIRKKSPLKGFPDIAGIISRGPHRGMFFALELKSPKGRLTAEQISWGQTIDDAGGLYAVIKSLEELQVFLARWH